jgi:dynein heavy chain
MLNEEDPIQDPDIVEFMYIFCIIWSLGACLKPDSRKKFEDFLRRSSGRALPATSLFDNFYDYENARSFILWEKLVGEYQPPADGKFSKILVPTVDTKRFSYLLK